MYIQPVIYGRPGLVVTWGKLSQWLFKKNYLLERSNGHILDVSVNANSFVVQFRLEIECYIFFHGKKMLLSQFLRDRH